MRVLIFNLIIILFDSQRAEACLGLGEVDCWGSQSGILNARIRTYEQPHRRSEFSGDRCWTLGGRSRRPYRTARMPNGQAVTMIITHALGYYLITSSIRLRLSECYLAWADLNSFITIRRDPEASPDYIRVCVNRGGNSLLGKVVYLAGTVRKVGKIMATYDTNPITLFVSFPTGFTYDLSLITDHPLPRIINPPENSRIVDEDNIRLCWTANQSTSVELMLLYLHGATVVVQGCPRAAHAAIAAGAECTWLQKPSIQPTFALQWWTRYEEDSLAGFSEAFTVGELQPVLFQTFQRLIKPQGILHEH